MFGSDVACCCFSALLFVVACDGFILPASFVQIVSFLVVELSPTVGLLSAML